MSHKARVVTARVVFCLLLLVVSTLWVSPAVAQTAPPEPTPPAPDPRFGLVEAFWEPAESAELRIGWERILFYWREIQPTGPDDWNTLHVLEEWLAEADLQGREIMGVLKNTPAWATDDDNEAGLPRGLYLPIDDPENLWANYVRRIAQYYGPRGVHEWVIWNEPDIERGVYGYEFAGDEADYVQLLKIASIVIKQEDPQAKIHLAGVTYWHDPEYLDRLMAELVAEEDAADYDYYFDVLTLHIYFRSETVPSIVDAAEETLEKYGLADKEVWINETNAAPSLDPQWEVSRPQFPIDLDQQAWYLIQAHALGFAAGADSIGVYKLRDIALPPGGESFGILRPDGSRRPAYYAYKNTIQQLSGFIEVAVVEETPDYYLVRFDRPEGVTHVAWSRTDSDIEIEILATESEAFLVNAVGDEANQLEAVDGFYRFVLAGGVCTETECLVGGEPFFFVEDAPLPTVTPTYTPTATPTETPTSTSTPINTPTATATATPSPTVFASSTPTILPVIPLDEPPDNNAVLSFVNTWGGLLFVGFGGSLGIFLWMIRRRFRPI